MRTYVGRRNKVYRCCAKRLSRAEALIKANTEFKVSYRNLVITEGTVIGNDLYLNDDKGKLPKGEKEKVWVIYTK